MANNGMRDLPHGAEFALKLLPVLEQLEAEGKSRQLAKRLNELGLLTPAGKRWGPVTVSRLIITFADVIKTSERIKKSSV